MSYQCDKLVVIQRRIEIELSGNAYAETDAQTDSDTDAGVAGNSTSFLDTLLSANKLY